MNKRLAIIGAGDLGQLIANYAKDSNYQAVGFYDDFQAKGTLINNLPIIGALSAIKSDFDNNFFDEIIIGIGYNHLAFKEKLYQSLFSEVKFATIVHSSCIKHESVKIEEGVCILPGCVFDNNVTIKSNVLVNLSCTIAHDSIINSHTFLSPRTTISGFVKVGERCNIGVGTTVIDNTSISDDIQTGGGTIVINNLEKKGLYVGNPARFIR